MKGVLVIGGIILLLVVGIIALNDCGRPTAPDVRSDGAAIGYDGTVYYFENVQSFGSALAAFIKAHPELRVVSVAPLDNGGYGSTRGYWVVVEKRTKESER